MKYVLITPSYYIHLFQEVKFFLKQPTAVRDNSKSIWDKIVAMLGLYIVKMILVVLAALLMAAISPWFDPENISKSSMASRFSPLMLVLVGGLILPSIEEVGFRLSLWFKPAYLAISTSIVAYYILTKAVFNTSNSMVDDSFTIRVGGAMVAGLFMYSLMLNRSITNCLSTLWKKRFGVIFYTTSIAFACIHILNFELTLVNVLLLPLLVFPQFLSAIIYGYTRVVFGFQYPLIFHCSNNLLAIGISQLPFEGLIV